MVNDNAIKVTYTGDGQTTVFPFSFPFDKVEYIHIAIYDTATKEITYPEKDYIVDEVAHTVTYPGYAKGQEIKESERPAVLDKTKRITIFRSTDIDQLVDLGEKYPLATLEGIADKVTEILQELKEQLSRAILVKLGSGEDPQNVYNSIWDYAKTKAEEAFGEPAVTDKIQQVIDEATAAAQKELAVLDANDILGKVTDLQKTDEKLESTIAQNKTDTDKAVSDLKQTADSITATVAQNKTDAETAISKVDQKADSISATVQANKTSTDTAISNVNQRADSITSTVQEQKEQFDGKIGGLSSQITQNANSITSVITNLKDTDKAKAAGYSAITQLQDEINLRVKTADYNGQSIVNQINLNSGGVLIDGSRVHITGDTKIDKDLIVGGNVKAGSLTIDNIAQSAIEGIASSNFVEGDDGQYCRFKNELTATPRIMLVDSTREPTENKGVWTAKNKNYITETGAAEISVKGFRILSSVRIPAKTECEIATKMIYTDKGTWERDTYKDQDWTTAGYTEFVFPCDQASTTINIEYGGETATDTCDKGEAADSVTATSSITVNIYVNGVSKYGELKQGSSTATKTFTIDGKKGDRIRVDFIGKEQERYEIGVYQSVDAIAYATCRILIPTFTPTVDIKTESGSARFLYFITDNQQYTLED